MKPRVTDTTVQYLSIYLSIGIIAGNGSKDSITTDILSPICGLAIKPPDLNIFGTLRIKC